MKPKALWGHLKAFCERWPVLCPTIAAVATAALIVWAAHVSIKS